MVTSVCLGQIPMKFCERARVLALVRVQYQESKKVAVLSCIQNLRGKYFLPRLYPLHYLGWMSTAYPRRNRRNRVCLSVYVYNPSKPYIINFAKETHDLMTNHLKGIHRSKIILKDNYFQEECYYIKAFFSGKKRNYVSKTLVYNKTQALNLGQRHDTCLCIRYTVSYPLYISSIKSLIISKTSESLCTQEHRVII